MPASPALTIAAGLIGPFRTFGAYGPVYQVLHSVSEQAVRIRVVQTGEEIDYPMDQAAQDPVAN